MRGERLISGIVAGALALGCGSAFGGEPDLAVERGRLALTSTGYLKPAWGEGAYRGVAKLWDDPPSPDVPYAASFNRRYGLHPAPFPNDGLPMGLRRGEGPEGVKTGLQIDCMVCHGGSIGGTSYVGLGNTTLDLKALLDDLTRADGRRLPPSLFTLNSTRGTVNAGTISVILLSLRNANLSKRLFPLPLAANIPELDVPAWWTLGRKATMYQDGRTDARSARSNMQFLLGEKSLDEFKALEPTFRDIQAYLKSLKPPKYPFPIDTSKAARGQAVFARNCTKCHGTYGPDGEYPGKIVDLDVIGTDPARALGISDRLITHYNSTWFGEDYPVSETMTGYQAPPLDGIWSTAPYLHNGSVPTLALLLDSAKRPPRFQRPPSTDFDHYDQVDVGWKFETFSSVPSGLTAPQARYFYDTARFGLANGGHRFGDRLGDGERSDLIEYLKTL